ncbi:MAG: hypothetical protein H7Y32_03455 [Chloroflexales bacterium]|nr:hypothetical protein [Chloroflexales bacterium]
MQHAQPPERNPILDFVVAEFGKHTGREAVVRAVAEQFGQSWEDAEKFVRYVEREHGGKVARRQAPLLLFMGISTLLIGLALVLWNGWWLYLELRGLAPIARRFDNQVIAFGTGIAMVSGAGLGLYQLLREMTHD